MHQNEELLSYFEKYYIECRTYPSLLARYGLEAILLDTVLRNNREVQLDRLEVVFFVFVELKGENITLKEMKNKHDCDPVITNKEMGIKFSKFGEKLNESDLAIPCGLMAKSFKLFNNSYNFTLFDAEKNEQTLFINSTNIARKYDKKKYKNSFYMTNQWLDLEDEHFMVWMRPAPFANFSKLYGRINQDIEKVSVINVSIVYGDYFDKEEFNKSGANVSIIITTINYFGGKNYELSYSFVGVGILCFVIGIIYIVAFKCSNKKDK